ncbi:signal peptidase I [Desulfitobacterium metallireducens DSM 15288]|uniref:Signal peptidase I n=2 Tax=Desulfitobacterium TaxID=36853 RepID=W0E865_9FIRM|nr:signal peptidase I [Desulfitobacterium metallireducens]AHF06962.1 signal peptidase I [Desulfitobacterium metallireducens DSM 15288]
MSHEQDLEKPEKSMARYIFELVEIVLVAFALSWLIRTFVIEARIIPTGSMLPTIQLQDRVIVDKFFFKNFGELQPGDIIVFHPPASAHSSDDFIKRLIAMPGDKVEIKNHDTYVNGQKLIEPYLNEHPKEDFGPIVVPENSLFVMGDNRNNSADSREWGFLPAQNVTGRTLFRYWPLNHFGPLAR